MCPGSRPATGWMPNRTSTPRLAQLGGELGDGVLRLRDRHAVAGRDDDGRRRRCSSSATSAAMVSRCSP